MKAVIVGHGPSMLQEEMGLLIDEFDCVIRLKRCQKTLDHPEHYGTRTDVVCGSWSIARGLKSIEADRYWVFLDSRHGDVTDGQIEAMRDHFAPAGCRIDRTLCDNWNALYRGKRNPMGLDKGMERKATSDDKGHTHMSAGLHALLYAAQEFDEVVLVGFDNVATGQFTWSITRGPDWNQYPDHNWATEQQMVADIGREFGCRVGFMFPDEEQKACAS